MDMKTPSLKRIVGTFARSFAEGMLMTDPFVYTSYLRCKAEEQAAPRVDEHPNRSALTARTAVARPYISVDDGPSARSALELSHPSARA